MAILMSNTDTLKRFLLTLPKECDFNFTNDTRKQIREALFLAISNQGKYLDWLFPNAFQNQYKDQTKDVMIEKIDKEFEWLFANYYRNDLKTRDPEHDTHNHHAFHSNSPCARMFRRGEPIYRCLTCGFDDTCALCSHCYKPEYHEGHKVHITICQRENGGVCDCGDPEAWIKEFICPYASQDDESINIRNRKLPDDLEESFFRTIETLLDYVIDVMSQCDLQFEDPEDTSTSRIEITSLNSTLDPKKYGYYKEEYVDKNSDRYYLMVYNDQVRHYRDAVQRIHLASRKLPQFASMVTDKVQSYGKAKVISSKNIKLLQERQKILSATGLVTCIRSHRDIFREDMCDEILIWINDLTESEMFKININAKNLFCKAFCCKWNNGLMFFSEKDTEYQYKIGTLDLSLKIPKIPSSQNDRRFQSHWFFKPSKWNLPKDICEECNFNLTDEEYDPQSSHLGSRLQYFIYLDIRFWKSIRNLLHDMYSTSLITNLSYKNIISCQYVDIYPTIADMFLTMDREPELNIMCTLSTQLFTCPSNSTSIVQHGDISRIFASIYGFLTVEEIRSPENVDISHEISMKSLKNRRWGQIFFDIDYILSRSRDSISILTSNIIPMACDILALFQGRPVMKRESKNHVEYESPDYTAFFHAISVIYQFGEYIAHCLNNLKDIDADERRLLSRNAITYVLKFLLKFESNEYPGLVDEFVDINIGCDKKISKELIDGNIIQHYRIDQEKVSFLHPIHSFLSWLIEISDFKSPSELVEVFESSVKSYIAEASQTIEIPNPLTSIFDYPIRTIVLMSQIKSGFWVRNGFSVRSQLQLYRNTGLRESGYMRDLFLTQVFIMSNNPNLVCFLIFSRWLLMDGWLVGSDEDIREINAIENNGGNNNDLVYDSETLPYMIEECLNFFIHILTEDLYLRGLKDETINQTRIKNEIIHSLCFGPMNYTKLCSNIPDHITSDKRFDLILEDMSNFTSPNGSKDIGVYKLKDEYFDQVNPYYFNYTTNTKDEAIKFVKDRIHKKTLKPTSEIVIAPKLRNPNELGIYKFIGNFAASAYFSDFLVKALKYASEEDIDKVDSLLETTLHLIHICSFDQMIDIEKYGTFYDRFINISDYHGTSIAILLYKILTVDTLKNHHSKIRSILKVFEDKYRSLGKILSEQITDFDPVKLELNTNNDNDENEFDRKKRFAKERQEKLMAKFKKQQSSFLENNKFENADYSDTEMVDYEDETAWKFPEPHCLLCQNASENAGPFGIITYISKSSEFRNIPFNDKYWFLKGFSDNCNLDHDENSNLHIEERSEKWKSYMSKIRESCVIGPGFAHNDHVESKLISVSCGHGMHFQCYMNFLNSNRNRSNQITRNTPENIEHKEFLCPLCKAINNMFIPILWSSNKRSLSNYLKPSSDSDLDAFKNLNIGNIHNSDWFDKFTNSASYDIEDCSILTPAAKEMIGQSSSANITTDQQQFRMLLTNMFQILTLLTFPHVFKADSIFILVNSIKTAEIGLRGVSSNNELIINQLSNNTLINLRTLNEFRNTSLLMKTKNWIQTPNPKGDAYVKMLSNLLMFSSDSFNSSVLENDFFEILVNIFPLPSLGFSFNSVLKVCFMAHIIQNLFIITNEIINHDYYPSSDYSILDVPVISDIDEYMAEVTANIFKKIRYHCENNGDEDMIINDPKFGSVIYTMLVKASTPFLRRAAIYAYVVCADADTIDFSKYTSYEVEADKLCSFMNINHISQYLIKFNDTESQTYEAKKFNEFLTFLKTSSNKSSQEQLELRHPMEYPGIVKLTYLPERLDYFFTKYYYSDKYNNPHMSIEDPAICLFCAEVVDAQKSAIGCKEGQCTTHFLKECANNIGIFLLPKERSLLLLHKNGGSFYNAPFLDQHGELSGEAKKGKTLYLMNPRYDDFIKNVWLQHNVPNYIVRKLDSVMDAGGWDTL